MWRCCLDAPVVAAAALGAIPSSRAALAACRRCRLSPSTCFLTIRFSFWLAGGGGGGGPWMLARRSPGEPPGQQVVEDPVERRRVLQVREVSGVGDGGESA